LYEIHSKKGCDKMEQAKDQSEAMVMKLLHYFITEKNYNPIILQGAENEIWLENLEQDYKIVRIVSNYIHNEEQLHFDLFKTRKIMKKIKAKTFSFRMNVLSLYTNLREQVNLVSLPNIDCVKASTREELTQEDKINTAFPDLLKKLEFSEEGVQLFLKITSDINQKNRKDAIAVEDVFKKRKPVITYALVFIHLLIFFGTKLFGVFDEALDIFCVHGPSIRILGEYYRLFTGAFFHANLWHLVFNTYALYVIGSQVESFMGKAKYLVIYFFTILTSSLLSITLNGNIGSVGASGAIFGLMGCLLYFGYHYRVYLGNVLKSQIVPLVLLNLMIGFLDSGIDNYAHIGGLIGGVFITMALGVKYKENKQEKINGIIISIIFALFLLYMGLSYAR